MPKMNGFETLQLIAKDFDIVGIPVIMITGMNKSELISEAFELGTLDFLQKPVDPVDLVVRVKRALQLSSTYMRLKTEISKVNELNKTIAIQKGELAKLTQTADQSEQDVTRLEEIAKDQMKAYESDSASIHNKLHRLSTLIESLSNSLDKSSVEFGHVQEAKNLLAEINSDSLGWTGMESFLSSVYPGFVPKLRIKNPNLRINDIRHCAYIKMGLSVKDVADILKVSEKSVELNRDRVRSLFMLDMSDSLSDFVNNI